MQSPDSLCSTPWFAVAIFEINPMDTSPKFVMLRRFNIEDNHYFDMIFDWKRLAIGLHDGSIYVYEINSNNFCSWTIPMDLYDVDNTTVSRG